MAEPSPSSDRSADDVALVMTTFADGVAAEQVIRTLLAERLIACGNVVREVVSLYRWDESVERETEVIVLLKTVAGDVERVFGRVTELHSYAVPELIELPVGDVSRRYREWVVESTRMTA